MNLAIVEKYTQLFGDGYVWAPKVRDDRNEAKKNLNHRYLEKIGAHFLPTGVWFLPECQYLTEWVGNIYLSELKKWGCTTQKGATDIYRCSLTLCCMEIIKQEFGEAAIVNFPNIERFFDQHKTSEMTFSFEMVVSAYILAYTNDRIDPLRLLNKIFDYVDQKALWNNNVAQTLQSFVLCETKEPFPSAVRTQQPPANLLNFEMEFNLIDWCHLVKLKFCSNLFITTIDLAREGKLPEDPVLLLVCNDGGFAADLTGYDLSLKELDIICQETRINVITHMTIDQHTPVVYFDNRTVIHTTRGITVIEPNKPNLHFYL